MKNNIKKIRIRIILIMVILILGIYIKPTKAATTTLTASGTTVNSGESFSVKISSSTKLSGWTVSLTNNGGCTFNGASGGEVNGSSVYGTNVNGSNSLATFNFKAPAVEKDTKYTITFSGSDMADATSDVNVVNNTSCSTTITVKGKSSGSSGNSSGNTNSQGNTNSSGNTNSQGNTNSSGNTTTKDPNFKSTNQKVYATGDPTTNLRASWSTSSQATSVPKGTELTLTGTSTETINGYTWYRVTYQGATKYIASSLVTTTKPKEDNKDEEDKKEDDKKEDENKSSNKNLSSLEIDGIEITPSFNKDTTQYTAHIDGDVDELKINAKSEDSKAKVVVEGNKELKEGDNIVKVKVTAEDETTRSYFITVTKGEGTEVDTKLKLTQLSIGRVNFEETFKPDVYSYELDLTSYVENLDITATPSRLDATVDISGNENFQEGKNVIVILVTSADGSETATYQINVNVPAEVIEQAKEEEDTAFYILIGVAIAVVIIAIIVIVRHHRASKEDDYYDDEEDKVEEVGMKRFSNYESENQAYEKENQAYKNESHAKEENTEKSEEYAENSRNSALDDFFNARYDDDGDKRNRGRHSK